MPQYLGVFNLSCCILMPVITERSLLFPGINISNVFFIDLNHFIFDCDLFIRFKCSFELYCAHKIVDAMEGWYFEHKLTI
jgi:hypothetical protein